jgi:hypothetical protein
LTDDPLYDPPRPRPGPHNFFLGGLVSQGELREAASHLPPLIASARECGNFYLELELHTRLILVWLADDDPDGAERRGCDGIARWSQRGFQRQHYCLASLLGGDAARHLDGQASAWMQRPEIRNPAAMTRFIAPGFH